MSLNDDERNNVTEGRFFRYKGKDRKNSDTLQEKLQKTCKD